MRRSRSWTSPGWRPSISASRYSGDRAVGAGELLHEPLGVGVAGQGQRREPQARGPSFGPLVQQRRAGLRQRDTRGGEKLTCLPLGKPQVCRADLGQLAGQAQLMQAQPKIAARGQHRVHVRGKVRQQPGELGQGVRGVQLVQIVDDQDEAAADARRARCRQHPVDHRPAVEVEGRGRRFGAAGGAGGLPDRVEQGQPEILGVVLIAVHRQDSEPVPLSRTAGPRAQQRGLPAAGRSRDDRDLPRRPAIKGGEKITPVDQPGSCSSHRHGPALVSTPDTLTPVTRYWHLERERSPSPASGGALD